LKKNLSAPNVTEVWWDDFSAEVVAAHYYAWAAADPMVIGINPWYWSGDLPDATCGGYNVSVRQQRNQRQGQHGKKLVRRLSTVMQLQQQHMCWMCDGFNEWALEQQQQKLSTF
jgi:hypothetical protein